MHLGTKGWTALDTERISNFEYLQAELQRRNVSFVKGCRNDISLALLGAQNDYLHAFAKGISGIRTVNSKDTCTRRVICGREFQGWQAHHPQYPHSYVNVAVALGCKIEEINHFLCMRK
jgi:hypothetical protein